MWYYIVFAISLSLSITYIISGINYVINRYYSNKYTTYNMIHLVLVIISWTLFLYLSN